MQKATAKNDVGIVGTWTGSGPMLWVDHLASRHHLTLGTSLSTYLDSGANPIARPVAAPRRHLRRHDRPLLRRRRRGRKSRRLGQRRQLQHLADRRVRPPARAASSTALDRRGPRLRPRARRRPRSLADRDQPLGIANPGAPTMPANLDRDRDDGDDASRSAGRRRPTTPASPATTSMSDAAVAGTTTATTFTVTGLACSTATSSRWRRSTRSGNVSPRASVSGSTAACEATPASSPHTRSRRARARSRTTRPGAGATARSAARAGPRAGTAAGSRSTASTTTSASAPSAPSTRPASRSRPGCGRAAPRRTSRRRQLGRQTARCSGSTISPGHHQLTLGSSISTYLDSGASPAPGAWQHLAATFDGATARYYVDGVEVAARAVVGPRRQLEQRGGSAPTAARPGGFLDGVVDDVRIYNRPLNAGEIQFDRDHGVTPAAAASGHDAAERTRDAARHGRRSGRSASAGARRPTTSVVEPLQRPPLDEQRLHAEPPATGSRSRPGRRYTDTGLAAGAIYYYKVTAEDAAGNVGPASNEATRHRLRPDAAERSRHADGDRRLRPGVALLGRGDRQRRRRPLQRPPLDHLRLHPDGRRTGSRSRPGRAYVNTGLAPGTYYYKVTAEDAAGNVGPVSNQASAVGRPATRRCRRSRSRRRRGRDRLRRHRPSARTRPTTSPSRASSSGSTASTSAPRTRRPRTRSTGTRGPC